MATTTPATDDTRAILDQIQSNEMEYADAWSRALYFRPLAELNEKQARNKLLMVLEQRRETATDLTPSTCFQCGAQIPAGGSECRPCHESVAPHRFLPVGHRAAVLPLLKAIRRTP